MRFMSWQVSQGVRGVTLEALVAAHPAGKAAAALQQPQGRSKAAGGAGLHQRIMALEAEAAGLLPAGLLLTHCMHSFQRAIGSCARSTGNMHWKYALETCTCN